MENIIEVVNKRLIELDLKAESRQDAINRLAELLKKEKKIISKEIFINDVNKRETVSTTYCGLNIAIPHAVSAAVVEPAFSFGRCCLGIQWNSSQELARYIILMAVPKHQSDQEEESKHIELLSAIAELSLEENVRNVWEKAKSREEILLSFHPVLNRINKRD